MTQNEQLKMIIRHHQNKNFSLRSREKQKYKPPTGGKYYALYVKMNLNKVLHLKSKIYMTIFLFFQGILPRMAHNLRVMKQWTADIYM